MGTQPVCVAVGHRGDDQFVGAADPLQRRQPICHLVRVADELRCGAVLHDSQLVLGQCGAAIRIRVGHRAAAGPDRVHPVAVARRQVPRGRAVVGHHHVGRRHHVRLGQRRRRLESLPVDVDRFQGGAGGDVVARDERQTERAGDLCALPLAAAEHPRHQSAVPRPGPVARQIRSTAYRPASKAMMAATWSAKSGVTASGCCSTDVWARSRSLAHQGLHVERRRHHHAVHLSPLRRRRGRARLLVALRLGALLPGPTDAEIDAAGVERVEHAEALGDGDRRGVAELHGRGADPNTCWWRRRSGRSARRATSSRPRRNGARRPRTSGSPNVRRAGRGRRCYAARWRRQNPR